MSRIGKKPVVIPNGVEVKVNGSSISVKGPKGSITRTMPQGVKMEVENGHVVCSVPDTKCCKDIDAKFGLVRALVHNMIVGCEKEFSKGLEIIGVGYKAQNQSPSKVLFNIGYSHPVEYQAPEGITLKVEGNKVFVSGIDKEVVGQTAAEIRKIREPRHYKDGAGIRYIGENVRIKVGKKLAA